MSLEALGVGQGLDGNSQLSLAVLEIVTFHDADAACIAVNEAFIPMKPVCCCVQLMRVGSSASNGVDQARCGINSNGAAHFKEAWLALGHRVHCGCDEYGSSLYEFNPAGQFIHSCSVPGNVNPKSSADINYISSPKPETLAGAKIIEALKDWR